MLYRAKYCSYCNAPFVDKRLLNSHQIRCKAPKPIAKRLGQPAHLVAKPRLRQSDFASIEE